MTNSWSQSMIKALEIFSSPSSYVELTYIQSYHIPDTKLIQNLYTV